MTWLTKMIKPNHHHYISHIQHLHFHQLQHHRGTHPHLQSHLYSSSVVKESKMEAWNLTEFISGYCPNEDNELLFPIVQCHNVTSINKFPIVQYHNAWHPLEKKTNTRKLSIIIHNLGRNKQGEWKILKEQVYRRQHFNSKTWWKLDTREASSIHFTLVNDIAEKLIQQFIAFSYSNLQFLLRSQIIAFSILPLEFIRHIIDENLKF